MDKEIRTFAPDVYSANGTFRGPMCCGVRMKDDGGCSEGCCDDWLCQVCGKEVRTEAPD